MKKLLIALPALALSTVAMADTSTGCGLGTQLWAGQSGVAPKVLAVTTNGTLGNQTFGITSGSLGCSSEGVIKASAQMTLFIDKNSEALARDMAVGQGETLDVLASLMGVPAGKQAHFNQVAKANFSTVYGADKQSTADVAQALQQMVANDKVLSAAI